LKLHDGTKMPAIGFGTSGIYEVSPFVTAIKVGYRHIDTATRYENEQYIGQAITECIDDGVVKRDELFITTKLWHDDYNDVEAALRLSLKKL